MPNREACADDIYRGRITGLRIKSFSGKCWYFLLGLRFVNVVRVEMVSNIAHVAQVGNVPIGNLFLFLTAL